jgi:hypothetical protein
MVELLRKMAVQQTAQVQQHQPRRGKIVSHSESRSVLHALGL